MKTLKFGIYLSVIFLGVLLAQCTKEGPAGLDGEAGADGADGSATCKQCHADLTIQVVSDQFRLSGHFAGEAAVDYAGGRASCAECHSHEGFVEFAETGDVANDFMSPSAWKCQTCHSIHDTYTASDWALRLDDAVVTIAGSTIDFGGSGNLCVNCHQSRRTGPYDMVGEYVDLDDDENTGVDGKEHLMGANEFFINSTHFGPHHGAQGNLMNGTDFSEIAGSTAYPSGSDHLTDVTGGCTGCHMAEADYSADAGGHTFMPTEGVCNDCHNGTDLDGNFDYKGMQTTIEGLIADLETELLNANVIDGPGHPVVGIYQVEEAQAFFNYIGILEDRSSGVHNPYYIKALLENSIEVFAK